MDPMEISFGFDREAAIKDLETGEQLETQTWHIRREYQRQIAGFIASYVQGCLEALFNLELLNTNQSFDQALFRYLLKRKRLT